MKKFFLLLMGLVTFLFGMEPTLNLDKLKGSWTVVVALGIDPRNAPVMPAIHLLLRDRSDPSKLKGDVIGFESNAKIAEATCVIDESDSYDRSDYVCSYDYDSERHYLFVNDLDSTEQYFLGEYIALPTAVLPITYYNSEQTYIGIAVPKNKTVIIPMY